MKHASDAYRETGHAPKFQRPDVALWVAFLGGPFVALAYESIAYMLVPQACHRTTTWFLHLASLGAAALVVMALGMAARGWRRHGNRVPDPHEPSYVGTRRFLGVLGLVLGAFSLLVVVAQWLVIVFATPCKL